MFEKFLKDIIVKEFGAYVEDFTADDIQIDNWNGTIVKENVILKSTALEEATREALGAPVIIRSGVCRKIRIVIPWSEILSKPIEVTLDDIHAVCTSPPMFDKDFATRTRHASKTKKFQDLWKSFKVSPKDSKLVIQEQSAIDVTASSTQPSQTESTEDHKKEQLDDKLQKGGYVSRLKKVIEQNLRITLNNLHFRFEDSGVSRMGKSFNFGLTIGSLLYSHTNSRFERVFLSSDDDGTSNRSFKLLEIKSLALYWNTNVERNSKMDQNWTVEENPFLEMETPQQIEYAKQYTEAQKKRYSQYLQNYNQSQVYLVQPLDFSLKMRSNKNQRALPTIPQETINFEMSQLLVTFDEEIYKDLQHLMKFFAWHNAAVKKDLTHFKFRPAFNLPVKGNGRQYWQYAIKSTIKILKRNKDKQTGAGGKKKKMIELCELYKLTKFNAWIVANFSQSQVADHIKLDVDLSDPVGIKYTFPDQEAMAKRVFKLESKLAPEQLVVAFQKGEVEAQTLIEEEKQKAGWGQWLSSSVYNWMGYSSEKPDNEGPIKEEDVDNLMKKLEEVELSETSSVAHFEAPRRQQENQNLKLHVALSIPLIQISLVNRSVNQVWSKQFMAIVLQDLFLQLLQNKTETKALVSLKNFEIVDRLLSQQKFSRLIQKKEQQSMGQVVADRSTAQQRQGYSGLNVRLQYQKQRAMLDQESLSEIEEEMNPSINNGMQQIQDFNRLKNQLEVNQSYFLVAQVAAKKERRQEAEEIALVTSYNIDLVVTNLQIFYNRVLISRAQSFLNQATINRVQNAQAEADFERKVERFKQDAEKQVSRMLQKSEINMNCGVKSIEILAPDNTNYEMSKFLILHTGDIQLRSGKSNGLGHFFNPQNRIDKQISYQFNRQIFSNQGQVINETEMEEAQALLSAGLQKGDAYTFMVHGLKVLYIPTVDHLENYLYNDYVSSDIDAKHAILKKMDVIVEAHVGRPQKELPLLAQGWTHVKAGFGTIDVQLSNKEIQQLKDFGDNLKKYHHQIAAEVERELRQLQKVTLGTEQSAFFSTTTNTTRISDDFPPNEPEEPANRPKELGGRPKLFDVFSQQTESMKQRKRLPSPRGGGGSESGNLKHDESFQSANQFDTDRFEDANDDEDFDMEDFQDALDYFDSDIVDQIEKLRERTVTMEEEDLTPSPTIILEQKVVKKKALLVSVCLPKLKLSILEAQDLEKELMEGIREKIGKDRAAGFRHQQKLLDLDLRYKGSSFIELQLDRVNLRLFDGPELKVAGFFLKDITLLNMEKKRDPKNIFSSANTDMLRNFDSKQPFEDKDLSSDRQIQQSLARTQQLNSVHFGRALQGPEDEDHINHNQIADIDFGQHVDQWLEVLYVGTPVKHKATIRLGQSELEVQEAMIRKVYDTIIKDMPQAVPIKYKDLGAVSTKKDLSPSKQMQIDFRWSGINTVLRDKKDFFLLKLIGIRFSFGKESSTNLGVEVRLQDFQLIQDEGEIFLKHHSSQLNHPMQYMGSADADEMRSQDNLSGIDHMGLSTSHFETDLVCFSLKNTLGESTQEAVLSDFLMIMDIKRLVTIASILKNFESQVQHTMKDFQKSKLKPTSLQTPQLSPLGSKSFDFKPPTKTTIKVQIRETYMQLPAREDKNSLFLVVENLEASTTKDVDGSRRWNLEDHLIQAFVAQQFDQSERYNLLSVRNTSVKGFKGSNRVEVEEVRVTLNENYIMLISKLIDENFDDTNQLLGKLKTKDSSQASSAKDSTSHVTASRVEASPETSSADYHFLQLFEDDLASIAEVQQLNNFDPNNLERMKQTVGADHATVQSIQLKQFVIEWVFGQTFDEHQDQFVTLSNRNCTKMILEQFENEALYQKEQNQQNDRLSKDSGKLLGSDEGQDDQIETSLTNLARLTGQAQPILKKMESLDASKPQARSSKHQQILIILEDITIQQMDTQIKPPSVVTEPFQLISSQNPYVKSYSRVLRVGNFDIDHVNTHSRRFSILQISPVPSGFRGSRSPSNELLGKQRESIEVLVGQNFSTHLGMADFKICQQNAQVLSSLTKSLYSCKNVVYKGRRRLFLARLFASDPNRQTVVDNTGSQKVTRMDVANLRVIIFDSSNQEKEPASTTPTRRHTSATRSAFFPPPTMKASFGAADSDPLLLQNAQTSNLGESGQPHAFHNSHDTLPARSAFVLNLSISSVITRNTDWLKDQYGNDFLQHGLIKLEMLKLKSVEVYQNNYPTTLSELVDYTGFANQERGDHLQILHPTDILIRKAQFEQQANYPVKIAIDCQISTAEVEVSLKQLFKLRVLGDKIEEKLVSIRQILEHISKKNQKTQRELEKLSKKKIEEVNSSEKANDKHTQSSLRLAALFVSVIKEIGEGSVVAAEGGQDALSSQFVPLFSLEAKNVYGRIQKESDTQLNKSRLHAPFEVYYFNQSLNFFEPLIERSSVEVVLEKVAKTNSQTITLTMKDLLNVNLSVALYDQMFNFMSTLKQEQLAYDHLNQQQASEAQRSNRKAAPQKEVFSASSYYIKNSTGEMLMFKTLNQLGFDEVLPDEEYPIDFQSRRNFPSSLNSKRVDESWGLEDETSLRRTSADQTALAAMTSDSTRKKARDRKSAWHELRAIHAQTFSIEKFEPSDDDSDEDTDSQLSGEDSNEQEHLTDKVLHQPGSVESTARQLRLNREKEMKEYKIVRVQPRSIFRRRNYKFLKSEPKKVLFQIMFQGGTKMEPTSVFEVNVETLSCQRFYLDDQKEFYVICQTQQSDGKKHLIIRSPMQICNNLQIPMEIILSNNGLDDNNTTKPMNTDVSFRTDYQNLAVAEMQYEMLAKPETSVTIPLRACGFNQVKMRPIPKSKEAGTLSRGDKKFEWTDTVPVSLYRDEDEIFEQQPIVLESKMLRKKSKLERYNSKVYMVVNANSYSIRSYVDFNTQQTEFISLRYLSISPSYTFQNLVPAPITLFFKNISRRYGAVQGSKNPHDQEEFQDPQLYDLDLKHNSQLQILQLNPLRNFDISMIIPGYDQTDFVTFKQKDDEDFEICEDIKQRNYLQSLFDEREKQFEEGEEDHEEKKEPNLDKQGDVVQRAQFRFFRQKKILFNLRSKFQNQFSICANIGFIQGQYHVTFYSKYWLLNNTLMPLEVQISDKEHTYEKLSLPFENQDFDFETIRKFEEEDTEKEGKEGPKRKLSGDTLITTTVMDEHETRFGGSVVGPSETVKHSSSKEGKAYQIDYKQMINHQRIQFNERIQHGRVKPWEGYKFQQNDNLGLLGILSQQDIDSVQVVYFTQEEYKEEAKSEVAAALPDSYSQGTSQKDQRLMQAMKRSNVNLGGDQQSMMSKTSIQMIRHQAVLESQQAVPLMHTELSDTEIYNAPLTDKSQLKRIILFSDTPNDDSKGIRLDKGESFANNTKYIQEQNAKKIALKICDSDWTERVFDMASLQGESILLMDKTRKYCTNSMYEIVAHVSYLPSPFSFSKIIEFKPRYIIVNKTSMALQIIQAECQEKGIFKVYPFETSNFHWTDSSKPQEIRVRYEDHEYSGNIRIDGIGEIVLRLRALNDNDHIILNVAITEERNTLFVIFNDVSYAPPYRIENMTKSEFYICQQDARADDFDKLQPFSIIPYAWSYPLNEKLLIILTGKGSQDLELGRFRIDQISKSESIILEDKKDKRNRRQFLLEILNEKTMKVIRISYTDDNTKYDLQDDNLQKMAIGNQKSNKTQVVIKNLGISIISSQARELAYILIRGLKVTFDKQQSNLKLKVSLQDLQIDNQLVRKNDGIVMKRDTQVYDRQLKHFLKFSINQVKNDTIQNLFVFKKFYLGLAPFCLNLDGNFCDEVFKYGSDIIQHARKYQTYDSQKKMEYFDKDISDLERIKKAFQELKIPYDQQGRETQASKKVFFEDFYIHDIKMKFSFNSSPLMFREFTMNPTLKLLIVILSNLKKLNLSFSRFKTIQQQQLMNVFATQVKKHYLQQCYNHQQIFKLISSMGLFGNISESLSKLSNAFESLAYHPFNEDNIFKGILIGSAIFAKGVLTSFTIPVQNVFTTFKNGVTFLVMGNKGVSGDEEVEFSLHEKKIFTDDIEQVSKDIGSFGTPLNVIDTQNRIWIRVIQNEKIRQDTKRQYLLRNQFKNKGHIVQDKILFDQDESQVETNWAVEKQLNEGTVAFVEDQDAEEPSDITPVRFYQRQSREPQIYKWSKDAFKRLCDIPRTILERTGQMIDNMNTRLIEEQLRNQVGKSRPPRFTSFTMQLEPYSLKKAFALEILNDINLNVFQTETIVKLFTVGKYDIIITPKRMIVVEEVGLRGQFRRHGVPRMSTTFIQTTKGDLEEQTPAYGFETLDEETPDGRSTSLNLTGLGKDLIFERISNSTYKYWSIRFDDIMRIRMSISKVGEGFLSNGEPYLEPLTQVELKQVIEGTESVALQTVFSLNLLFVHSEGGLEEQQALQNRRQNLMFSDSESRGSSGLPNNISFGMADFRVEKKEITVNKRNLNTLKKIYKEIHKRSKQHIM